MSKRVEKERGKTMTITRKLVLLYLAIGLVVFTFAYAQKASAVQLKDYTVITGNMITVGDIFEGLPRGADKVLGPAPIPGQEMVLNARTLLRIALALDLQWKPSSSAEYVVLTSAATLVERSIIEDALREALAERGVKGSYNIIIPEEHAQIVLPVDQVASAEVQRINVKRDKNFFEATLVAPSKENPVKRVRVSGTIQRLVEIPVLKNTTRKGTIISKHDIEMVEVPQRRLNQDIILKAENLIGMTPRQVLGADTPVKANEIEEPKIVQRGEFVTMVFKNGPLRLTARGKALQHGAKGDMIRVVNTGSNKTVEGLVTASREVVVETY